MDITIEEKALSDDETKSIGKSLGYLNFLINLNIRFNSSNNFGNSGMISLSESFEKLTNLNDLSISVYQ